MHFLLRWLETLKKHQPRRDFREHCYLARLVSATCAQNTFKYTDRCGAWPPSLYSSFPLLDPLTQFYLGLILPPSEELKVITQGFKSRHTGRRVPRQRQLQIAYGTSFQGKHQFLQFAIAREPYKPSEWIVSVDFVLDRWSRGCSYKAVLMYTESSVSIL